MQITICRADCAGNARNCRYPTKVVVADAGMMKDAVAYDHVCGEYKGSYRSRCGAKGIAPLSTANLLYFLAFSAFPSSSPENAEQI